MELPCWCLLLLSSLQSLSADKDFFTSIGKTAKQHMVLMLEILLPLLTCVVPHIDIVSDALIIAVLMVKYL